MGTKIWLVDVNPTPVPACLSSTSAPSPSPISRYFATAPHWFSGVFKQLREVSSDGHAALVSFSVLHIYNFFSTSLYGDDSIIFSVVQVFAGFRVLDDFQFEDFVHCCFYRLLLLFRFFSCDFITGSIMIEMKEKQKKGTISNEDSSAVLERY